MMDARQRRLLFHALLFGLACLHAWMAASVSDRIGVSSDEIAHLTAGATYWSERDYRLQPENGLLPQRLAGLPLALSADLRFPPVHDGGEVAREWAKGSVWNLGARYFFESGNDLAALLRRARWMIALLGGLSVWLIGDWARRLGGPGAGLLAAGLAAFSPTLLAHSGLATSDTAAGFGFVAATAAWWGLCHRITAGRVLLAGVAAGLLALAKYSAVLFAPIVVLLVLARLARRTRLPAALPGRPPVALAGKRRVVPLGAACATAALLAIGVIWAGYGFRYEARGPRAPADAGFDLPWSNVLIESPAASVLQQADGSKYPDVRPLRPGVVQDFVRAATRLHALPEAWLYGLAFVDRNSRYRAGFLAGEWRMAGWPQFFPLAALVKSTPVELLLAPCVLAAWIALLRGRAADRRVAYRATPVLAAMLVIAAAAVTSHLNIGHRHILPLYALGFVLVALLVARGRRRVTRRLALSLIAAAGLAQVSASLLVRPHYLAYFNPLAGGPDGGHRYLVDSSLDWGQGLPALKAWLDARPSPGEPVFLSYFGSDRPRHYGIQATRIGDTYFRLGEKHLVLPPLTPGLYVFSATMWQRVYTHARGPWTDSLERSYWRQLKFWVDPAAPAWDGFTRDNIPPDLRYERLLDYEHLRFGRLCHYLAKRSPDAIVAHQFLVFRLAEQDISAALYGPPPPYARD